jgi:phospholipid/cholesterol/gamma-HCH transport system substrate-binding protein
LPTSSVVGRIAGVLALIGAAVVLLLLVVGGGSAYTVTANFENASQLVPGNNVNVAGVAAGSVKEITLADDGQAEVKMEVSEEYAPLPEGTQATVRSQSLSGIANRYVDLSLPPEPAEGKTISDGGVITQENTTSEVDLDELFNTLDEETVASLKSVIKGFARSYDGVGPQANRGFYYLNPFLSTSRRVFGELNSDQPALESLIVDGASLTEALAERAPDLEALIGNLDQMMGAIGRQEESLASAIGQFPDFMRQFNTTAFNLRAALDDVDPLITASRPVARKLQPFTKRLRGFARDAVPAVRDLDSIVRAPGAANDLIELTELQVPLAEIGVGPVNRNGAARRGALPESVVALGTDCENCTDGDDGGLTQLRWFRPYLTSDAVSGWFDDFGHSGFPDALGGVGRISTTFNAFTPDVTPFGLPFPDLGSAPLAPDAIKDLLDLRNLERCPGANVHGSQIALGGDAPLDYSDDPSFDGGLDCDPDQTLPDEPGTP